MSNNPQRHTPLMPPEWDEEVLDALGAMPGGLKFVLNGWNETGVAVRGTNMLGTMARHPALAKSFLTYNNQVVTNSTIPFREREVLILRLGWLKKCEYEYHMHNILGLRAGLTEQEIEAIQEGPNAAGLQPEDADLVRVVDELCTDCRLSPQSWERLGARYTQNQIMEIIYLVGCYEVTAMFMNSYDMTVEDSEPPLDPAVKAKMHAYKL